MTNSCGLAPLAKVDFIGIEHANTEEYISEMNESQPVETTTFVYGNELQGRGYANPTDLIFGYLTVGIVAFCGGALNLFLIHKLKAFHNAFGFFWAVRTIEELGTDITFAAYAGPVTV
uniref:7TM_GPCR_Srx domain-containing protein n=1 Tax=Steinernema glaseri TaxID=37863 RepID=A0A1I7YRK0_9BILA